MREAWTDDRLDDLNGKVGEGFQRVEARFDAMQAHIDGRFEGLDKRIDGLQRTLIVSNGVIVAALIGLIATQV